MRTCGWSLPQRRLRTILQIDVPLLHLSIPELLDHLQAGTFGTVFMSNYLEHLDSAELSLWSVVVIPPLVTMP